MKTLLIVVGAVALIAVGIMFVGGVSPAIVVAPEHIFTVGGLAITNTMFTSWFVVALLIIVSFFTKRGLKLVPTGFSAYIEGAVVAFLGIAEQVAGPVNGRRFFPLVGTIFFFVLTSNYFGLLPLSSIGKPEPGHGTKQVVFQQVSVPLLGNISYIPLKPTTIDTGAAQKAIEPSGEGQPFSGALSPWFRSVNTDVNAPLAIAIFSFIFVEFWGLQSLGPGYLKKFFAFGAIFSRGPMGLIDIFVGLLELVSELSRMVSFTFRLFGNVFAGEVLLAMMSFLVPFILVDVFYGLELFVGLIQAFVFAMLTLVFAVTAVSHHGGEEHEGMHAESEHHGA